MKNMIQASNQNEFRSRMVAPMRLGAIVRLALFSLVAVLMSSSQAIAQTCESAFLTADERLERLGSAFHSVAQQIRALPLDLISGERTPRWADFNQLNIVIQNLRIAKARLTSPEEQAEFTAIALEIARDLERDPALKDIANAHRSYQQGNQYKPTEYRLKLEYQQLLGKLNHELPRGARIPIQRLPVDLRRARLNQDARELMAHLEESFKARFPTTGFKTYAEYEAHLRSSKDPLIKKAIEMIDKNQIEVVIRRPESGRFWIPKVGLQNQYVTGSSKGAYSPNERRRVEQRLYDLGDEAGYGDRDPEFMPKYGTFRPAPKSGITYDSWSSWQYGEDFYVLRLADIQDRLSFTPDDSLHLGWEEGPLTHWSGSFIPWKYRLMMVELMLEGLSSNTMVKPSKGNWPEFLPKYQAYWETQILGALDLSNVESFQFVENPPSGAFLLDLLKRAIPIYDARQWPPVEWHPPASAIEEAKTGGL
jgi:hypothetical protein